MIQEISNFMDSLTPGFKSMGIKPKEGIHVLLGLEKKDGTVFMDKNSIRQVCYTKHATEFDYPFLQKCAGLAQIAWCANTNKCFDLPAKGIHTCSPYCVAFKKESLTGGGKYEKDKTKIYDRINTYFENALLLIEQEEEKERVRIFQYFLNSQDKLETLFASFRNEFDELKEKEYILLYLDVPEEKYKCVAEVYLADKLFNTNDYNTTIGQETYGTSDFLNGFPTKKPFLKHQSASFDIAGRVSGHVARNLFEFQDIMTRNILPRPLPVFIYNEELQGKAVGIFSRAAEEGKRIGYREIITELYRDHADDLTNYYLLFYYGGTVKDFDFVPKFRYKLQDEENECWEIRDYFGTGRTARISNVFDLEISVLQIIFDNSLVMQTKSGDFQFKYFDDIDPKYCKSEAVYLLIMKYRKAFYDYIYKGLQKAVTKEMFEDILTVGISDDIKLDEYNNGQHTRRWTILQKLNIWMSLIDKFNNNIKKTDIMAEQLLKNRALMEQLIKGEGLIETKEQYAFVAGQVIVYIASKSMAEDRSFKYLEPFIRQTNIEKLNQTIADFLCKYKHANFSNKSKEPIAQVLGYDKPETSVKELLPMLLSGIFSPNPLFSKPEAKELTEETEE